MSQSQNCRLFVGGLKEQIGKEDIEREFGHFGRIRDIWLAHDPPGFAFVEFTDETDAHECIKGLNGQKIMGCQIRVEISKGRPREGGGGRGGRGGGGRGFGRGGGGRGRGGRGGGRDFGGRDRYPPARDYAPQTRSYADDYYRDDYPPPPRERAYIRAYDNGWADRRTPPIGYRSRSPVTRRTPPRMIPPSRGRDADYPPPTRIPRDYPPAPREYAIPPRGEYAAVRSYNREYAAAPPRREYAAAPSSAYASAYRSRSPPPQALRRY